MGMAIFNKPAPRKPWTPGNVICPNCEAEYKPGNWFRAYPTNSKTDTLPPSYIMGRKIDDKSCPFCGFQTQNV
jgi:rubrerythrin